MENLLAALEALRSVVSIVKTEAARLDDLGEPPDFQDVVDAFVLLGDLQADLREARADVGEAAHHAAPGRQVTVDGVGLVEQTWGFDRSGWQHDDLFDLVLARSRDERKADPETGEYEDPAVVALRVLRDCAGIGYWKVGDKKKGTGLRARGIDPDEYCKSEPKRPSITVPGAAKRAEADAKRRARAETPLEAPESAATAGEAPESPEAVANA